LDTSFGQRNLGRVEGAINGPLSSSVDGRFAFQSNHYDPLFRNLFGGASDAENGNDFALRAQLLFKLPDSSQLLMSARYARQDVHAGSWEEYATLPISAGYDALAGPNDNPYGTCPGCNASGLKNSGPFVIRDSISGFTREKATGFTARYTRDFAGKSDRKSTRLNSSHVAISYAVFCLKKKRVGSPCSTPQDAPTSGQ